MNLIRAGRQVINLDFMRRCQIFDDGPTLLIYMVKFYPDSDLCPVRLTGQEAVDVFAAIHEMAKDLQ